MKKHIKGRPKAIQTAFDLNQTTCMISILDKNIYLQRTVDKI